MKILFIYPDIGTHGINFCPAIHILSAVIKNLGHKVDMLHINNAFGIEYDKNIILQKAQGYDLFAFTATSFNYFYANEIAGWLEGLKILGGCHATIQPEDFEGSNFDMFCIGEGEETMSELVTALDTGKEWKDIPGLITRFGSNKSRGFLKDLNKLPFNDYDIINTQRILENNSGWFSISFSRGCPYACTFCINQLYKDINLKTGKVSEYMRKRTPSNSVDEMLSLISKYDIKIFNLDDDLLTMDRDWMREFTFLYKNSIFKPHGIKYAINSRASFLDDEMAFMLGESGCREVRIGFETGNEKLRNQLLKKNISNDALIKACQNLDKYSVNTDFFAMMGVPGETKETIQDTIDMVIKTKPKLIRMNFLHPYKHTRIYDYCVKNNLFKEEYNSDNDRTESPLKFLGLSDKDIFSAKFFFPWYVNNDMFNSKEYSDAIDYFKYIPFIDIKKMIPFIINMDNELSESCQQDHYRYMPENSNYFIFKKI